MAPALAAATQTIAPTQSATAWYTSPVRPSATKTTQVAMIVAIVMPEIGLDEVPMMPTIREDTVTKKKPNTTTSRPIISEPGKGPCGKLGSTVMISARTSEPNDDDAHAEIALGADRALRLAALAERLHRLAEGRDDRRQRLDSVITPAQATAPAPM